MGSKVNFEEKKNSKIYFFIFEQNILDDRSKHTFNNIHDLLDAKVLLKHLYNSGVQYLLESKLKQIQFETNANSKFKTLIKIKRTKTKFKFEIRKV